MQKRTSYDLPSGPQLHILEEETNDESSKNEFHAPHCFFLLRRGFFSSSHGHKIYAIGDSIEWYSTHNELIAAITAKKLFIQEMMTMMKTVKYISPIQLPRPKHFSWITKR